MNVNLDYISVYMCSHGKRLSTINLDTQNSNQNKSKRWFSRNSETQQSCGNRETIQKPVSLDVDSTHPVTSTSHLDLLPSLVLYTGIVTPLLEHHALRILVGTWQGGSILLLHNMAFS